jgi:dihydrofolate reductase
MKKRKLILYIACSVDGYIAKPGDDLSFLKRVEQEGEDYGYFDFVNQVDTVIVGRNTYQWILDQGMEYPHKDKTCFIITRTPQESIDNIHFYTGDLEELVNQIKAKPGKDIYCDGGAQVVRLF